MKQDEMWAGVDWWLPAHGEVERFVKSFPSDDVGEAKAWRLGDDILKVIRRRHLEKKINVLVQLRPHVGWGVWVVLLGKENDDGLQAAG